ncbi:MAG: GxxExxY protein [Mariprofundaceae bacterium]
MNKLVLADEVYEIIGAAMDVHNELGCGFLEAVYQEALAIEFQERNLSHTSQAILKIHYKDQVLLKNYIADFICFDQIIVEIKALNSLSGKEESQILNYLKASGLKVGVLVNFGAQKLEWKRYVY